MRGVAPGPCAISAVRGFAHVKDKLENKLHKPLCAGTIPLDQAQHEIATDRVAAAVTYGVIEPTNSDTAR
jgi:hypothetical protein